MRTTVTIESDVEKFLRESMQRRALGESLVLNHPAMTALLRTTALLPAILGLALLLPGCSSEVIGVPPSLDKPIVNYPAESRIYYRDDESSHFITLMEDGLYRFESDNPYDGNLTVREGRWAWRTEGSHKAELRLDNDVWILTFVDHYSAVAVNSAAPGRTFAFQFERL
jgi:hypothetical protein